MRGLLSFSSFFFPFSLSLPFPFFYDKLTLPRVAKSLCRSSPSNLTVLVTDAASFIITHASLASKCNGDNVLGLDLKCAHHHLLECVGVFLVEGNVNDATLLRKLFDVVLFSHVFHLVVQAGI
ncbi:hypothetical protein Fmac_020386 [Flemingia macrophylla]|uniref:Secreted protein n=1 Tax=Flemingia macrophylla TaxID=520843 RepID=A0ABD1LTV8_9FABA